MEYRTPRSQFIGQNRTTAKLYKLEEKAGEAIRAVAEERRRVAPIEGDDGSVRALYRIVLPQVLLDLFERYETGTALCAARAFVASTEEKARPGRDCTEYVGA